MTQLSDDVLHVCRGLGGEKSDAARVRLHARFAPVEPAAKRESRTWPSLDQVPHDVAVTDSEGDRWEFLNGWRYRGSHMAPSLIRRNLAPFVEVLDGAQ